MTFEQLNCFIKAVEEDTFFDAAEALHTTQSTLSKQIMKLEKELNLSLFDRSKRSAVLTPSGSEFYKQALLLYQQYEAMLQKMEAYHTSRKQELRVGILPIQAQYQLTSRINLFTDSYPEYHVFIEEAEDEELLSGLNSSQYDMIIARENLVSDSHFQKYPLAEDELVALLPSDHPLSSSHTLTLLSIADEHLFLMPRHTSIYRQCINEFMKWGIVPKTITNGRTETLINAVELGQGISLMPKTNLKLFTHQHLSAISIEPHIPLRIVLAWKKERKITLAMKHFIDTLIPSP